MRVVFVVPPVAEKLDQDCGVCKGDSETDGKTLPQFLGGRDTHSKFLDGISQEKGKFPFESRLGDLSPRLSNATRAYLKWPSSDNHWKGS